MTSDAARIDLRLLGRSLRGWSPLLLVPVAGGIALAIVGPRPAAALIAGLGVLVATFAVLGVSSDRLAFGIAAGMVVLLQWNGLRFAGGAVSDSVMVMAFAALLPLVIKGGRAVPLPPWMAFAAAGLVVAALLTIVFPPSVRLVRTTLIYQQGNSPMPQVFPYPSNISPLVKFEIAWLILPLILAANATSRRRCLLLIDLWTAAAVVSALIGVLDLIGIAHLAPRAITNHRSAGLTIHPNYLAFASALAIPFALLWCGRGRTWTVAGVIGTALLLGGVYASGSRAATVGAVMAVALTVIAVPRLRRAAGIALPFAGMAVLAMLVLTRAGIQIIHQLRLNPGNNTALRSNVARQGAAQVALAQFNARPLQGVGFSVIEDAHDIYLQLLAAGGLIAIASFAVYCAGLTSLALRAWRGAQRSEVAAAAVSILVWLIAGVFDNQLVDKFLYVVPGLLLALSRLTAHDREPLDVRQPVGPGGSTAVHLPRQWPVEGAAL